MLDVDLILESIFSEYKTKCIKEGKDRLQVERHLELIKEQAETSVKDSLEDFIGRPANDATRSAMRDAINRSLNQFLDTDITLTGISMDRDIVTVDMSFKPKYPLSGILVQGSVTVSPVNPGQDAVSHSL